MQIVENIIPIRKTSSNAESKLASTYMNNNNNKISFILAILYLYIIFFFMIPDKLSCSFSAKRNIPTIQRTTRHINRRPCIDVGSGIFSDIRNNFNFFVTSYLLFNFYFILMSSLFCLLNL